MNEVSQSENPSLSVGCGGAAGSALWEAYGPSKIHQQFDHESHVGPTAINEVCGPLCIVGGDTDAESLLNAQRIAELLNLHGLQNAGVQPPANAGCAGTPC
jgi:hypothetical protein